MSASLKSTLARCAIAGAVALGAAAAAAADEVRFDIARFQVDGNTLLGTSDIDRRLAPLAGHDRAYADIQRAVEALQDAYRQAGYTAVAVSLPEQELSGGVVRIRVVESVIGSVRVTGNQHFGTDNIRASLLPLQEGRPPNLRAISEAIQLANDNPAKQVGVSLSEGATPGSIDADVAVTDHNPLRLIATIDNSGTPATGDWRTGIALQHADLFGRDQVGTVAYTTSPDKPQGARMDLYSIGYRIPFYGIGDSMDFVYGKSNVDSAASSPTLGGVLGFTGKGDIYGVRWNHFLGRDGEGSSKLVLGLDRIDIDSSCNVGGEAVSIAGPTPPIAACVPYRTTPLSLTYAGQRDGVERSLLYSLGISRNIPGGNSYTNVDGRVDRYSYLSAGNRDSSDDFVIVNGAGSIVQALPGGWQARLAGVGQYTHSALVASAQFSLTGALLVRGFEERAVVADSGVVVNAEIYTPELGARLGLPGQLRLLAFVDGGHGSNNGTDGLSTPFTVNVSSTGLGARYAWTRDLSLRLDVARVLDAGNATNEKRGDWRAQFSAVLAY